MIELIGDHRVFRGKKGLKQASVGVKAGRVKDGVLHLEEIRQLGFQLLVDLLGAADEAYGGKAKAPAVVGSLGGGDDLRVIRQAQVVVGAHVQDPGSGRGVDAGPLGGGDDALVLVGACFPDGSKLRLIDLDAVLHNAPP